MEELVKWAQSIKALVKAKKYRQAIGKVLFALVIAAVILMMLPVLSMFFFAEWLGDRSDALFGKIRDSWRRRH